MHDLNSLLQEPSAIAEANAPMHVQRMLQAFHRDTWFQIGTQHDCVRTEIGSRPGDSFADIVFGLLWAKLLKKLEVELVSHGILDDIPLLEFPNPYADACDVMQQRIPLLGPTWMDDLSLLIAAPSNTALIAKVKQATSLLLDACHDFHMAPNLKRGKTEVMITFRGPQSKHFRREYFSAQPGLIVVCENKTVTVPIVTRYVHLGGLIHHRDVNRQEIKRRLAIANQAFQQHKRLIYRNKQISWNKRCDIFNTLILSKFLYGLESWTFPTNQCRLQIHNGVMRLYRKLLGLTPDTHLTDVEVLVQSNMPDPTELLRRARLRYFGTLHNCRYHAHWGLIREDTNWTELLRDDLEWLWTQIRASTKLDDPAQHFLQWQDLIIHHGVYWKKLIRKGIQHACLQRKKEYHAIELHQKIGLLLQQEGWVDSLPTQETQSTPTTDHQRYGCMQCGRNFASHAGESVHMCRTHGIIAQERFLFDGTHCPSCLKEYHSTSKVLAHLRSATRCRDTLRARRMRCIPMPGTGSQSDRHQLEFNDGALPALQAHGPRLPAPQPQQWEPYDIPFFEALYMHLVEDSTQGVLAVSLKQFIRTYPISWTNCKRTLEAFSQQFTVEDAAVLNWSHEVVLHCVKQMTCDGYWDFLHDAGASVPRRKPATICEWEAWCTELAENPPPEWTQWTPLPQSLTKHKVLLHAFAGRRRRGDIEWYLDALSHQLEGCVILTVSIDIVIDPVHGDIAREETRTMWLNYIRQGHVAGFLAGPPCNTWSRVRAVQLADKKGPRVIRTPDAPWGMNELRMGELQQVTIGTILLGFAFECMLAMAMYSGSGLLEHPKDSEDESTVSIWRLPILQMLLQFPGMRLIHLSQGLFGAPSPKPTTLLALRLPTLERSLHEGMLCTKLAFGATTGKDDKGNFNTAPLKEYPPGLCRILANSFCTDFCAQGTSAEHSAKSDLPTSFLDLCDRMRDHDFGNFIGLD